MEVPAQEVVHRPGLTVRFRIRSVLFHSLSTIFLQALAAHFHRLHVRSLCRALICRFFRYSGI